MSHAALKSRNKSRLVLKNLRMSQGIEQMSQIPGLSQRYGMDQPSQGELNVGRDVLAELMAEKNSLDHAYVHCSRLLDAEISRVQSGELTVRDPNKKQSEKIYIPYEDQRKHNLVGRLLGPKGLTLKRIQAETQTKMSILGRGSMRDKAKEEELRNGEDPSYEHLKDSLHILVEAAAPFSNAKLGAGVAEIRKMLIPPEPGQPDVIAGKYSEPSMSLAGGFEGYGGGGPRGPLQTSPSPRGGFGRGGRGGGGGRGRGAPRGRGGGGRGGPGGPMRYGSPGGRGRGGMQRGGGGRGAGGYGTPSRGGGGYNSYGDSRRNDSWREQPTRDSMGGGGGGPYRPSESYSQPIDSDPYYSSFSDTQPAEGGGYGPGGGGDWKTPRAGKRDYRHHPYQQPSGSYY